MLNIPYHPYLGEDIYAILTVGLCHRIYELDISYETFCEGYPPRYGRYDNYLEILLICIGVEICVL